MITKITDSVQIRRDLYHQQIIFVQCPAFEHIPLIGGILILGGRKLLPLIDLQENKTITISFKFDQKQDVNYFPK